MAFKLERRGIENQRIELMASGRLRIEKGTVSFRRNKWNTGGMANKSFLQDEGNIKLLRGGTPVGKIPYFHLFVNQGEVARPPKYVELTKKRRKEKPAAQRVHSAFTSMIGKRACLQSKIAGLYFPVNLMA